MSTTITNQEQQANEAIRAAILAVEQAMNASAEAGYGSLVQSALWQAHDECVFAYATATDRN